MKILIVCEFSQVVCEQFILKGHNAYSCDIQKSIGKYPEKHILSNVKDILYDNWDLVIAHPPCTYLTNSQTWRLLKEEGRFEKMNKARNFFMMFYNYPGKIAIENPLPSPYANLPKYDQIIQPFMFGEPFSKITCLWLKDVPPLIPTFWESEYKCYCNKYRNPNKRSITFKGIASAMANQWG